MAHFHSSFNWLPEPDRSRARGKVRRMKAMVLAAGLGTRMGKLTESTPKPLLDVGGETLLGRQLVGLAAAGITDVVVNVARHGRKIREAIGDGRRFGVRVEYSDEGPEPLETAGGIVN